MENLPQIKFKSFEILPNPNIPIPFTRSAELLLPNIPESEASLISFDVPNMPVDTQAAPLFLNPHIIVYEGPLLLLYDEPFVPAVFSFPTTNTPCSADEEPITFSIPMMAEW
ncbi:MAG: hypothetical protein HFJ89_11120 [Oscillospiraceae bacterium]|nr:hypothetical protein [Oscillospiraceae bacterium]